MARRFVIGDIHGGYLALNQCLEKSGFDETKDQLICLGDVTDGWPETRECIDKLMMIPNLVMIKGNHDSLTIEWARTGIPPTGWHNQGGYATIDSYAGSIPSDHLQFLEEAKLYHLSDNQLFVHAGIQINKSLKNQDEKVLLWDRSLYQHAFPHRLEEHPPKLTPYDAIYIGHSPINRYGYLHPIQACEVWMLDTGAGWDGVLSIMDIDTHEYWTSDPVKTLYPDHHGRYI
jgi:serine/threonine protein phosphatase 1